jgi:3-hydroxybutyrate dehydrogenase
MGLLDGKVAAITAGTRSIGRAIAEIYLAEGASVVVNGRGQEKGFAAVEEMRAAGAGDRVLFVQGDASIQSDVENVINATVAHFGRLDIAVLNAGGVKSTAPVAHMTDEEWHYELNLNLNSTFWGMRASLQHMIPQQSGRIICMSSVEGKRGTPGIPGYAANKHAIIGLSKSCANEVGEQGITVNAICPGLVMTDMFYETGPATVENIGLADLDALASLYTQSAAIKRPVTVEEVAAVALLLASPAGAGITGTAVSVDGGTSHW